MRAESQRILDVNPGRRVPTDASDRAAPLAGSSKHPLRPESFAVRLALTCVMLGSSISAQALTGTVSPAVTSHGYTVQLTITATSAHPTVTVMEGLVWSVHEGSPQGPVLVDLSCPACPMLTLHTGQATSVIFAIPVSIPPGTHYLRVPWAAGSESGFAAYPVVISGSGFMPNLWRPSSTTPDVLRLGTTSTFAISGNACAGFPYIVAASNTTNFGFQLPTGMRVALDVGTPLWDLSFPTPEPTMFYSFQGNLAWPGVGYVSITIPQLPALAYMGISIQAVIISPGGGAPMVSNPLTLIVLP